ncbi:MAG: MFS transporter [Spirochaetales bacterium]|nr:MFS transporter [Spirochaetales bacterium]
MALAVLNRFLHWMIIGIISPILVLMILSKGAGIESVGYIMALLSAFVVIFELPSGILSDRMGRKKIYLLSLVIFFLSLIVVLFSHRFITLGIGFSLFGLARAFSSGSIESDFVDEHIAKRGKESLHKMIMGMNIGETLGLAIGALIGGLLPQLWVRLFPTDNMYNGNIIVQMIIIIILLIITALTHASKLPPKHEKIGEFLADSFALVKSNKVIRLLLVGILLWGFSFNAIELYWQPALKNILASENQIWLFGALNSGYFLMAVIGTLAFGAVISLFKMTHLFAAGVLKIVVGVLVIVLAFQSQFIGFSILFLLIMGFNGMVTVPESTVLNLEIPEDKRSSLLSLSSLVMQIGAITAAVVFSIIISRTTISIIWIIAGIVFTCSAALYFYLDSMKRE